MMAAQVYRPHDLLWLRWADRFDAGAAWPEWMDAAWMVHAPVVVRREAMAGSRVPVGARGSQRNQRCKGYVQRAAVARCVTPEMLAAAVPRAGRPLAKIARGVTAGTLGAARAEWEQSDFAPVRALEALAARLDATGLAWGPTGGTGFFLASGLPVLRVDSDLDLLVRAASPLARATVDELLALQAGAACRVDIQVDTGWGGFALAEYAQGSRRMLLKTADGPRLVADPWQYPEAA
jgi:phosphoribosyl-dephospho-CoA transferase